MRSLARLTVALIVLGSGAASAGPSQQQRKLDAGKAAIERLRHDERRRKYRDGWEAIERDLDAALRIAPKSALAPEVAWWAARARVEMYEASRIPADVRAAIAALRKVDEDHPGAPQGERALILAVQIGVHAHERSETAATARRLAARYGREPEARAALAMLPKPPAPAAIVRDARGAVAGPPQRPIEISADEDDAEASAGEVLPVHAAPNPDAVYRHAGPASDAAARHHSPPAAADAADTVVPREASGGRARSQPGSEVDVPREAANLLREIVAEARAEARPMNPDPSEPATPGSAADATAPATKAPAGRLTDARKAPRRERETPDASPPAPEALNTPPPATEALKTPALAPAAPKTPPPEPEELDSPPPEPEAIDSPPHRTSAIVKLARDAVARLTEPEDEPDAAARARELRTAALSGGSSLAAQLGLKVRRVVIDPGHGGKDTGAIGAHGVREKDIALSIAKRLATRLRALNFAVTLTRKDDSFVSLDDRTRIANEARADLFVSIHCNAARKRTLSGVETWTLNVASDRYAARLSAFENADDERTVSDLRLILADLATKANAGDARELAQSVQSSLVRNLRSRVGKVTDHGVKQALFYVLLGTHMPSILVETAFLSNPSEEARLRSARYQNGAAEAIARGVKDFVDSRRRLALAP